MIGGGDFLLKHIILHMILGQLFSNVHGENVFHYPVQSDCIHLRYNIFDVVHDPLEIVPSATLKITSGDSRNRTSAKVEIRLVNMSTERMTKQMYTYQRDSGHETKWKLWTENG